MLAPGMEYDQVSITIDLLGILITGYLKALIGFKPSILNLYFNILAYLITTRIIHFPPFQIIYSVFTLNHSLEQYNNFPSW